MSTYHVNRALEIVKEEGLKEFYAQTYNYIFKRAKLQPERFKYNTIKNNIKNQIRYNAPPNISSLILVDPNNIYYKRPGFSTPKNGLGKILDGDWDAKNYLHPIKYSLTLRGIEQRFNENKDWEDTIYYDKLELKHGEDEDKIKKRCEYVDFLYNDIKNNKYKSASKEDNKRQRRGYGQYLEVLVVIDRDGRIHHQGKGSHRLGIARVLNINIPVQVLVRHKKWQETREKICKNGFSEEHSDELRSHPDLNDIIG